MTTFEAFPKGWPALPQIYQDTRGKWRWRLRARNRKIIADSAEGYHTKFNAERAWRKVKEAVQKLK